jgi:uncharacterized protein (TIGR00255 family)
MIRSMTGFGQSGRSACGYRLQVELKSVNHRYLDIVVRMSREWLSLEDGVRREIQHVLNRGRVDAFITIERETSGAKTVEIDWTLADAYAEAANRLKERYGLADSLALRDMLSLPDVVAVREAETDAEQVGEALLACVREACAMVVRMREAEGAHLARDIAMRLDRLEKIRQEAAELAPQVVEEYRTRLHRRISELLGEAVAISPDDPRLAMETALMADRCDIGEELTRLASHIDQCRKLLASDEPVGRKLDFLIQEMNREANTIGSKSNHIGLTERVVEWKAELEKLREQAQNIE